MNAQHLSHYPAFLPQEQLRCPSAEERAAMIRERAYFLAQQREFCPGHELKDWLAAEQAVDATIGEAQILMGFYG